MPRIACNGLEPLGKGGNGMRRSLLAALAASLVLGATGASAQGTRWIMASAYAEGAYHTRNIRAFIEDVERTTGGRLAV
jgi:TRAP-type transport system periplasmic protein